MQNKNKLWQTDTNKLNPLVEDFTVGDDYVYDQQLIPYDIRASLAHTEMLFEISVINKEELDILQKGLNEILKKWKSNEFVIEKHQEDGHTAIEQYLTENFGEAGKKIHTGRSRNDQSLVMLRLFMKESLIDIQNEIDSLIENFNARINKYEKIAMPGYTHLQKAMPATVGMWLGSFLSGFKDFKISLKAAIEISDQNPLGSASGFGIDNFPLNREFTTEKLGFNKTQENPMYCGFSRGYFENITLQTLMQPMIIAAKFANDMLFYTTQECDYFSLPDEFTTGSSIMPQKRNYDVFEIMRGNVKVFSSYQNEIQDIVSSIGSGYQRDLQLTKKPFVEGINLCSSTVKMLSEIISQIQVNELNLKAAMSDELFVTNEVYELVKDGKSFRDAYSEVKKKWLNKS